MAPWPPLLVVGIHETIDCHDDDKLRAYGSDCNLRQGARHLKGTYKGDFFTYYFIFFGPIWAHMGPALALEEREKFNKNAPFFKEPILIINRCF